MKTPALLFDCDGVLADTELNGHLPAFNQMWRELGVNWQWSAEQYIEKLKIGGGKERMLSLKDEPEFRAAFHVPAEEEAWWDIVAGWHKRKSEIYKEMIAAGNIPGRSGVKRITEAALDAGWIVAVCSTSAVASVESIAEHVLGAENAARLSGIFAGDMVKAKKPAPDVYNLAVKELGLDPARCVVVEDSRNGLLAAVAARMTCVVTYNEVTQAESFDEADLVISELGEPGADAITVTHNKTPAKVAGYFSLTNLEELVAG